MSFFYNIRIVGMLKNLSLFCVFLIKYNSSGTKQWTKQFGTSSTDRGVAVTTDNSGSVFVTGVTSGGLEGNTHSGYTNCGGTCPDMFLIKFNSDGVLR